MKSSRYSWVLLSFVFLSFMSLLGSSVTRDLRPLYFGRVGANPVQIGLLMAIPDIVSIFTRVPSSSLSHRLGRWRMMLFTLILMLVSTGLFAFVRDPVWFYPLVTLGAFSWAAFSPVVIERVLDHSTSSTRGDVLGLFFTSIGAAMFVGPLISSVLTAVIGLRQLFLVATVIPVVTLLLFLVVIKPEQTGERQKRGYRRRREGSIRRIFKVKNFAALSVARIAYSLSIGIFSTVYPVYAAGSLGFTPSAIALLFTFRGVTNVILRIPAGRLSDRIGRRKPFIFAIALVVVVYLLLGTVESFWPLVVVMSLFGVSWGMRMAPSMALVGDSVLDVDRPLSLVLFMSMYDLGSALGSLLAGFSSTFLSHRTLLLICPPILLGSLLVFIFFSREVNHGSKD
ncbi:MAG: MFS transporter [Candidatus Bathyarchaeota archaeon]|nr:MFS transporter [Candidatus Bathyarchaeota archaeon]